MRRLFLVSVIASFLVAVVSMAWATINLNSSKSNIYRMVYDTKAVTPAQAAAVLKELDKIGPEANEATSRRALSTWVNEATVRKLLQKQGVDLSLIKQIRIIPAGERRGSEKIPLVIIVTNPGDVPAALAVSDEGVGPVKPIKSTK